MPMLLSGRACRYTAASAALDVETFCASRPTTVRKPPFSGFQLASMVKAEGIMVSASTPDGRLTDEPVNIAGPPPVFLTLNVSAAPVPGTGENGTSVRY